MVILCYTKQDLNDLIFAYYNIVLPCLTVTVSELALFSLLFVYEHSFCSWLHFKKAACVTRLFIG